MHKALSLIRLFIGLLKYKKNITDTKYDKYLKCSNIHEHVYFVTVF